MKKNTIANDRPDLLCEWDYKKNNSMYLPDNMTVGSDKKVWWICPQGHSYDMSIYLRAKVGCSCPICNGKRVEKGYNDFASLHSDLISEWNFEKNDIAPDEVTEKSHKNVWWKCSKCGTEWKAPVSRISSGGGCPTCGREKTALGRRTADYKNSLAAKHPDLIKEWDFERNVGLEPDKVYSSSNRKVWWKCSLGHSFSATVSNRTGEHPTGCPYCSNKATLEGYNDLLTLFPEIAKEWDYSKNKTMPTQLVSGSNKKAWWICPKGHSYQERIVERTGRSRNCPYCSGQRVLQGFNDLYTTEPNHVKDWDYKKNTVRPTEVTSGSNRRVWWKCSKCGHEWQAMVNTKTRGDKGCPICSRRIILPGKNDFASEHPELLSEWSEKNTIDPTTIASGSGKKVWWECSKCGFLWKTAVYNRVYIGSGCPDCAQRLQTSMPEQVIYQYLKKYYPNTINGYKASWLKPFEIDVYIPELKCGIEYDGAKWHSDFIKDERKSSLINKHGIALIRVREEKCPMLDNDDIILPVEKYDQNINSLKPIVEQLFFILNEKFNSKVIFDSHLDWDVFTRDFVFDPIGESLADGNPELSKEWDYEKNGKLKPENISCNSSRKVWWKCPTCGFSYCSQVGSRNKGTGCPACRNLVVYPGHNDLATLFPDIAKEWAFTKNMSSPKNVGAHSSKKVWWRCGTCGYEWEATIANRTTTKGTGCPACAHQAVLNGENDLATRFPEIAAEWDYSKNNAKPRDFLAFSEKRVWWVCPKGHSYDMPIQTRTFKGSNCPICGKKRLLKGFSDLQTRYPDIAEEWDYEKNGEITPDMIFPGTNKKYWWKCKQGHSFEATPNNRTSKGRRCPYCSGRKKVHDNIGVITKEQI